MTRSSIKVKPHLGEGGGKRITLILTLDEITLNLIKADNVDQILEPLVPKLRQAVQEAAGLDGQAAPRKVV